MAVGAAIAVAALGTASAVGQYNQAKSQARLTARQAEQEIQNRKNEILALAAKQKVGYIQGGVELEGTAQAVIQDTYNTGLADVEAIKGSAKQSIKNQLTAARANLLKGIADAGASAVKTYSMFGGGAGIENMAGQAGAWNPATSAPAGKPV